MGSKPLKWRSFHPLTFSGFIHKRPGYKVSPSGLWPFSAVGPGTLETGPNRVFALKTLPSYGKRVTWVHLARPARRDCSILTPWSPKNGRNVHQRLGRSGRVTLAMIWWASAHHAVLLGGPTNQPTNKPTNERTDKAFLGVGRFLNVVGFRLQSCLFSSSNLESLNQKTSFKHYYCFTHSTRGASIT